MLFFVPPLFHDAIAALPEPLSMKIEPREFNQLPPSFQWGLGNWRHHHDPKPGYWYMEVVVTYGTAQDSRSLTTYVTGSGSGLPPDHYFLHELFYSVVRFADCQGAEDLARDYGYDTDVEEDDLALYPDENRSADYLGWSQAEWYYNYLSTLSNDLEQCFGPDMFRHLASTIR